MVYHITGASGYFAGNFIYHNMAQLKGRCKLYDIQDLPVELLDLKNDFIKGDINETLKTVEFKEGDILINFASYSHVDYSFLRPDLVFKNNVRIGQTIFDILTQNRFLYLVHISTDEITTRSSPYSESKYQQELLIRNFKSDRVVILRFNNLYGNGPDFPIIQRQPCLIPNTIKKRCIVKQGNTQTNTRNFMYIGNAIEYVKRYAYKVRTETTSKIYNLYYGRVYTVGEVHGMLINLFEKYGIDYDVKEIPDRKINDPSYPSHETYDETHETFKKHLQQTFNFIVLHYPQSF